ncbi:MAG: phosphopantothenoylcysteine decarboxylase/phosphopantothenate--cysteine ligase [Pontimonas sp.]|jgi:phosphopantothenoylcysteine decarboxylase/phosphopantothenate--cysteine ligase
MAKAESSSSPLNVVVGVAGGIAAYKAVILVRELVLRGHIVTVIPTASALKFVGMPTWEAISRNRVFTELFDDVAEVRHVALGQLADLVIIAPATAHTIANMAAGLAPDLLGTTLLATAAPVLIAPAMHTEMWDHPSVVANIAALRSRGIHIIGPESGPLTGMDRGVGRMSEPDAIADYALSLARPQDWAGKNVLISAGGTREYLDPVRFLGNRSTGEMGVQIAAAAARRGASVTLVAAHLEVTPPSGVRVIEAPDVMALAEVMIRESVEADVVFMAAAVADWVPDKFSAEKLSKADLGAHWAPELVPAPDILAQLGAKKPQGQILVGFTAETEVDEKIRADRAKNKMAAKNVDVMVANLVGERVGFGVVETTVTLFFTASPQSLSVEGMKSSIAERLLDALLD